MSIDWKIKALAECASRDSTRYQLTGVAFKDDYFYSTDGHRLMVVKHKEIYHKFIGLQENNRLYETTAFKRGALCPLDAAKLVEWKQIGGWDVSTYDHTFKTRIPTWFSGLKVGRTGHNIKLTADGHFTTGSGIIGFNPAMLAPLAACEDDVYIYVKDAASPLVIEPKDASWRFVAMPLRGSMHENSRAVRTKEKTDATA